MTTITFKNDSERENFRFQMCLQTLEAEATNTMGIRFYRGSIVNVLRQWVPDLPRTKKNPLRQVDTRGFTFHFPFLFPLHLTEATY